MTTECNQASFEFHALLQRKIIAKFDGGNITSDAGILLLREVEKRTGIVAGLAACFTDYRDREAIEHTVQELHAQCQTIRLKLLKIGAQIRVTVRNIWISLAGGYPYAEAFAAVLRNLQTFPLRC